MNGDLGRARPIGARVVLALCALSACNAAPQGPAPAPSANARTAVVDAVRAATDRSGIEQSTLTLPDGQRLRRLSLRNGFGPVLIGRMGPDGKPVVSCVSSAPTAEAFLAGAPGSGQ